MGIGRRLLLSSCSIATLTIGCIAAAPVGSADVVVPFPLDCGHSRKSEKAMVVWCTNTSDREHITVRVSVDCGYWPDPDATFYLSPRQTKDQYFECHGPGSVRNAKYEIIP